MSHNQKLLIVPDLLYRLRLWLSQMMLVEPEATKATRMQERGIRQRTLR